MTGENRPEPQPGARPEGAGLSPDLRDLLRCPVTGEALVDAVDEAGAPVLLSLGAGLAYPVRDGVPVLLAHEATRLDA